MRKLQYALTFAVLILGGCAGSPARMNSQSVQQIQKDLNLPSLSNAELCREKKKSITRLLKITYEQGYNAWGVAGMRKMILATDQVLTSRGYDKRYCEGGTFANKKYAYSTTKKEKKIVRNSGELRPGQSFFSIKDGMYSSEVFAFLGAAANTETNGNITALQYCQTVRDSDFYFSIWMKDGVVVGKSTNFKKRPAIEYQAEIADQADTSCVVRLPKLNFGKYRAESGEIAKSTEISLENENVNTEELVKLGFKYSKGIGVEQNAGEVLNSSKRDLPVKQPKLSSKELLPPNPVEEKSASTEPHSFDYSGDLKDGVAHGRGKQKINGVFYRGEWKNGKLDGSGEIVFANGRKYEGEFREGFFNGKGKMFNADGSLYYDGEFKNNLRDGFGISYSENGGAYEAFWSKNKIVEGTWKRVIY